MYHANIFRADTSGYSAIIKLGMEEYNKLFSAVACGATPGGTGAGGGAAAGAGAGTGAGASPPHVSPSNGCAGMAAVQFDESRFPKTQPKILSKDSCIAILEAKFGEQFGELQKLKLPELRAKLEPKLIVLRPRQTRQRL